MRKEIVISKSPARGLSNPTTEQILYSRNYVLVHWWIKNRYGKANKCTAPNCPNVSKNYEWALIKGKKYEKDIRNFMMMCRSCHHKYDVTEEFRQKRRDNATGKKPSLATRKKQSDIHKKIGTGKWMLGRKMPQSVRDKMSKSHTNIGSEIRNKNTNEVYRSLAETASKNNMSYNHLEYLLRKSDVRVSHLEYVKPKKNNRKRES